MAASKNAGNSRSKSVNYKKRRRIQRNRIIVALALVAMIVIVAVAYNLISQGIERSDMRSALDRTTFFEGIYINNMHVGGMTVNDARAKISSSLSGAAESYSLSIVYEDMSWKVDSKLLRISDNAEEILVQAHNLGRRHPSVEENYNEVMALKTSPVYFTVETKVNTVELDGLLDDISQAIDQPSKDASIEHFSKEGGFVFSQEETGLQVDRSKLRELIIGRFSSGELSSPLGVPVDALYPKVKKAELETSYKLISSFKSETTSNSARNHNITLALAAVDGSIVGVGEEFSLNNTTGERTSGKGYQEAGAIKNGILIPELGGGVCQVSTSLFNAVVRAGLSVTERNNHSYPISYIDIGMDAMIDFPASDFRFVNNSKGDIYIASWFDSGNRVIHIEIYGIPKLDEGVTVSLRSEIYETIPQPEDIVREDPALTMPAETRVGRTGYRTNTYVQYYKDGVMLSEELLCKSYYRAIAAIYTVPAL